MSVSGWGATLGTTSIDNSGAFVLPFTVPGNASIGATQLLFSPTCSHSTYEPSVTFTVTQGSPGVTVPAAPSNLRVTPDGPNAIRLDWNDNSDNEAGFEINNGVVSRNAGADSTTYTWSGLAPGTYMCFKIRSYNSAGSSAWEPDVSPWYRCTTTLAARPAIHWSRTSGIPRTHFMLTGSGWIPGGTVRVQFPTKGIFFGRVSWHVDSHGRWNQPFATGDTSPGKYTFKFSEASGHLVVTGTFTVLATAAAEKFTWDDYLTYLERFYAGFAGADESLRCLKAGNAVSYKEVVADCLSLLWKDAPPVVHSVLSTVFDGLGCFAAAKSGSDIAIAACMSFSAAELLVKGIHAALKAVPGGQALLKKPFPVQP